MNLPPRQAGAGVGGPPPAPVPDFITEKPPTQSELQRKRDGMERLIDLTTCFSVFVIAYLTIYANDTDYGTFTDYLQTVLYGLGLSTAGSGILNKARSSFVKTG